MSRYLARPKLEWKVAEVFLGPTPKLPARASARTLQLARRYAGVQVSTASAGFDAEKNIDRVLISYKLGWVEVGGEFTPLANIPDERVGEFIEALQKASSMTSVARANATKAVNGQFAVSLAEALKNR